MYNDLIPFCCRYLAFGESMLVMYAFHIGKKTVSNLILQCCNYLWETSTKKVHI